MNPMQGTAERKLITLVIETSRHLQQFIDRKAQQRGLTGAQLRVLSRLRQCEGINQAALAADLEMRPISLGELIDKLAGRDMVERQRDILDRRINRLHLTRTGKHVAGGLDEFREAVARDLLDGIDETAINATLATLFKLKMRLSDENGNKSEGSRSPRACDTTAALRR